MTDHICNLVVKSNFSQTICFRNIVQQFEHPSFGGTELILSNGMRVCYKCTDFLADQVQNCVDIAISVVKRTL